MKKSVSRILAIVLLLGVLFTQGAVHFFHNHSEGKISKVSEQGSPLTVLDSSDNFCLACSLEFTTALFYASFATFVFIVGTEIFHAVEAIRPSRSFSISQIGRAPPLTA